MAIGMQQVMRKEVEELNEEGPEIIPKQSRAENIIQFFSYISFVIFFLFFFFLNKNTSETIASEPASIMMRGLNAGDNHTPVPSINNSFKQPNFTKHNRLAIESKLHKKQALNLDYGVQATGV